MYTPKLKQKIKEFYFRNPTTKLRVREIERTVNIPLPSVIKYTKELVSENILKKEGIGTTTFFTANRDKLFFLEKKLYNLQKIYNSGVIEYIQKELHNPTVILFGSFAKGEDTEESDIDIYIQTSSRKKIDLKPYFSEIGRDFQIFQHKHIKELQNTYLMNNIVNGITLNGFIEVFNET